jgi:hypothetical protein
LAKKCSTQWRSRVISIPSLVELRSRIRQILNSNFEVKYILMFSSCLISTGVLPGAAGLVGVPNTEESVQVAALQRRIHNSSVHEPFGSAHLAYLKHNRSNVKLVLHVVAIWPGWFSSQAQYVNSTFFKMSFTNLETGHTDLLHSQQRKTWHLLTLIQLWPNVLNSSVQTYCAICLKPCLAHKNRVSILATLKR